jgi:hypothetical protein
VSSSVFVTHILDLLALRNKIGFLAAGFLHEPSQKISELQRNSSQSLNHLNSASGRTEIRDFEEDVLVDPDEFDDVEFDDVVDDDVVDDVVVVVDDVVVVVVVIVLDCIVEVVSVS